MQHLAFALLSLLPAALAFNYTIGVGKDEVTGLPGVGFDPSRTVVAADGDILVFSFLQGQHRVVRSSFAAPCTPTNNFDTGLQTVPNGTLSNGPDYSFTVTNHSEVLFFSDIALVNCLQGAVFCVNTNESSVESCSAFKAAALALGSSQGVTTSVRTNTPFTTTTTTTTPQVTSSIPSTSSLPPTPTTTTTKSGGSAGSNGASIGTTLLAVGIAWALTLL